MANDVRTQVTKRLLKEAFQNMVENGLEDEINVKTLCARAQVSRVTFYAHYHDIFELIAEDEMEKLSQLQMQELIQSNKNYLEIAEELFLRLLEQIDKHAKLYRYYFSVLKNNYIEIVIRDVLNVVSCKICGYKKDISPDAIDMFVLYHSFGIIQIFRQWINYKDKKPCTREEYAKALVSIMFDAKTYCDNPTLLNHV